ncbi:MAG: 16S rRNA (guanine(966)-N(2))-methyltransferase RsmD [Actinomycetota bacterium]
MRVIAGIAKGHKLKAPAGDTTRPPLDRQKEALFSMLGDSVAGARVLDLYAGSGSYGIEALSRGAASAVFVDSSAPALSAVRDNLRHTKLTEKSIVTRENVVTFLAQADGKDTSYDLIFLDPPFRIGMVDLAAVFEALLRGNLLSEKGLVVLRLYAKKKPPDQPGFSMTKNRAYGDSRFLFYKAVAKGRIT